MIPCKNNETNESIQYTDYSLLITSHSVTTLLVQKYIKSNFYLSFPKKSLLFLVILEKY